MKMGLKKGIGFVVTLSVLIAFLGLIYFYRQHNQADKIITDFHMHILSDELIKEIKSYIGALDPSMKVLGEKCDADTVISKMDEANIAKAFVFSGAYLWCTEIPGKDGPIVSEALQYEKVKKENDWAAAQAAKYPDRLIPAFSIHPVKDFAINEMDRCIDELGMRIIKLHLGSSMIDLRNYYHLKKLNEVLSHAEERNIPVIIHVWTRFSQPGDSHIIVDDILAKHPGLRICIAHLGYIGEPEMKLMEGIVSACNENKYINKNNLFFDISAVIWTRETLNILPETSWESIDRMQELIKAWGPERILWGSDFFAREPKEFLNAAQTHLNMNEKDMRTLLYKRPEDFLTKNAKH